MPAGWIAAGTIGSAVIDGLASQNAADTQAQSAKDANATTLAMYNQNVGRLNPYVQAGNVSLNNLQGLLGSGGAGGLLTSPFTAAQYQQSPGYQWQLGQGTQAITNQSSALGGVYSGNTLKALDTFGQGLANQDFYQGLKAYTDWQNQVYGMNAGMVNTGANAAGMTAGLGANAAGTIGANQIGAGNARAAGQVGVANALTSGLGSYGNYQMWQQMNADPNNLYGSNYIAPITGVDAISGSGMPNLQLA